MLFSSISFLYFFLPVVLILYLIAPKVLKKIDKLYEKGNTFGQDIELLQKSLNALKEVQPESNKKELEEILGDMLIQLSDIARIYKIPQEQILYDRIDELIEKYESTS